MRKKFLENSRKGNKGRRTKVRARYPSSVKLLIFPKAKGNKGKAEKNVGKVYRARRGGSRKEGARKKERNWTASSQLLPHRGEHDFKNTPQVPRKEKKK